MNGFERLLLLGERQHGVFSIDDRRRLDVHRAVVARAEAKGELERVTPRVLRIVGAPQTPEQRLMAAVLDAGPAAAASYASAAWLWGLPGFDDLRLEVTQLRTAHLRPSTLAVVHRPRLLLPEHVRQVRSITTMSLVQTIFDCAGILSIGRTVRLVDTVIGRHPQLLHPLHDALDDLAGRGKPGSAVMRRILRRRPADERPPQSNLERRVNRVLANAGEGPLVAQVDVGGQEWIGRADFRDPSLPLLVEVLSRTHHSSVSDRLADEARFAAMRDAGWLEVVPIWEDQVWDRPWEVVAEVRAARQRITTALAGRSGRGSATRMSRNRAQNEEEGRGSAA